ncbi:MAG: hypothetical protein J1E57_00710 [Prevotella sp.]|nr:hypothetical protein [Prevotella sp.]
MGIIKDESYKGEGLSTDFRRSCLGRLLVVGVICGLLLLVASMTVPSGEKMAAEIQDDIVECLNDPNCAQADAADDFVRNLTTTFTKADSIKDPSLLKQFYKYNKIEVYPHTFYSTARLHNSFNPDGIRVAIGLFGLVFPTDNFSRYLLREGPLRKGYNERIIKASYSGTDLGHGQDFGNTYNTYEGGASGQD